MADKYIRMEELKFLLHEVHSLEELLQHERFQDYDSESIDILLQSVKEFADTEMFPYIQEMDEKPARYEDGKIIVHPQIKTMMEQGGEMGLIGATFDEADGGMQLPTTVDVLAHTIMESANNHMTGYIGLTAGAAHLIASFGSDELKERFIPDMLAGKWGGTMALTEPQAGSSLSDITTSATPNEDGSYNIIGQKIFISGGDHEYSENFVHLTLVRIDGAPAGTKGISLFAIPKNRKTADGTLEWNDVVTAADFQKMGQRGYCTTHLSFGENNDCRGWLVGQPNRGLSYMFQMMNGARIAVGNSATSVTIAAYYASLQYALERPQGRRLSNGGSKDLNQDQTLIINHPDVRRMLLLQKSIWMGALSLVLQAARYQDMKSVTDGDEKEMYDLLLEILTPIAKTFPSEMGQVAVSNGVQVLGGYGYCTDFILQQYYRDVRIMAIYEGTTGIQSLDLLGRKITMHNGKAMKLLAKQMMETISEATTYDELKPYAADLGEKLALNKQVLETLIPFAVEGDHERFLADASVYMEFLSTLVVGWQWLKMATTAKRAEVLGTKASTEDIYEGAIHTMRFYFKYEMTKTTGLAQTLMDPNVLTVLSSKEMIQ
ncbi:MAG: acyl-CoA dehydrogenase [Calditrichia bacterium]